MCRITPCPQVIVESMTFLKPNVQFALVCEQPVHFCFDTSTKEMLWMIWAVLEIHVGNPRSPVYAKLKLQHFGSMHCSYVEVEKIDPAVFIPVEHSRICSCSSWWHASPFLHYYRFIRWIVLLLNFGLKSVVQRCGRARPDHKNVVKKPLVQKDISMEFLDDWCFQQNHEDCGKGHWKGCTHCSADLLWVCIR